MSYAKCKGVKSASEDQFVARLGVVDTEEELQRSRSGATEWP